MFGKRKKAKLLYDRIGDHALSIMGDKVIYPEGKKPGVVAFTFVICIYILNTIYRKNDITYYVMKIFNKAQGDELSKFVESFYYETASAIQKSINKDINDYDYFLLVAEAFLELLDSEKTEKSVERSLNYITTFMEECESILKVNTYF